MPRSCSAAGADPFIGPRLPSLLLAAGCAEVAMQVVQPAGFDPDVKVMAAITTEGIAARVEAAGLATRAELAALADALHAFARDAQSVMSLPRIVQAWGRSPAAPQITTAASTGSRRRAGRAVRAAPRRSSPCPGG